ncbi:hypothetical protein [Nostoc sp.]|uniref:hypothetical protein n=1 Tax=Nostoc sp. TaxID=1180 RepID=UPI003593EDDF
MDKSLLKKFRKAYQDLELFPLITARQVEAFRVDFANETIARLEQAVVASLVCWRNFLR